jgi:hypothetical protein
MVNLTTDSVLQRMLVEAASNPGSGGVSSLATAGVANTVRWTTPDGSTVTADGTTGEVRLVDRAGRAWVMGTGGTWWTDDANSIRLTTGLNPSPGDVLWHDAGGSLWYIPGGGSAQGALVSPAGGRGVWQSTPMTPVLAASMATDTGEARRLAAPIVSAFYAALASAAANSAAQYQPQQQLQAQRLNQSQPQSASAYQAYIQPTDTQQWQQQQQQQQQRLLQSQQPAYGGYVPSLQGGGASTAIYGSGVLGAASASAAQPYATTGQQQRQLQAGRPASASTDARNKAYLASRLQNGNIAQGYGQPQLGAAGRTPTVMGTGNTTVMMPWPAGSAPMAGPNRAAASTAMAAPGAVLRPSMLQGASRGTPYTPSQTYGLRGTGGPSAAYARRPFA